MKEVTDIFLWIGLGFLAYFIFYVFRYKISDFKSFLFSCFLFCSAQNTLTTYVVSSDYIEWMPHVFRSAGFVVYLISPLIFLYIRELLFQKGYQKYDWVHILPGVFYVIDHIPFYLMDGEAKLEIVNHLKSNGTLFLFYILFTFAIPPLITVLELTPYSAENFYLILFSVIGMISLFILFLFTRKES